MHNAPTLRPASWLRGAVFTGSLYVVLLITALAAVPFLWHPGLARRIILFFACRGVPFFLWAGGVRLQVRGRENFAAVAGGPYVVVANHSSFIDPLVLVESLDGFNLTFVIKREMTKRPMLGNVLTRIGYFVVDRQSPVALKRFQEQVLARMKAGWVARLGIFPEGTRSLDGRLQKFHAGPFLVAAQLGIPILPVIIRGAYNFQPPNRLAVSPGAVRVEIQPALTPPTGKRTALERLDDAVELQRHTEAIFKAVPDFTTLDDGSPDRRAA